MPPERIRLTDRFDDPNLPGEIQLTVTLKKVSVGTELNILQEGVPDVIPAEACYLGWQESLLLPAELVEGAAAGLTVRARPSGAAVNIIGNNYGTSSYQSAYFGAVPCFVSVGWSWAVQLEPFKQMFIDSGMPMDFIEKLNAAIKDVQHAMSEQEFSKGARLKAAAATADTRSNTLSALHRLDPIMDNLLRDIHPLSPCGNVRGVWNAITSRNLPILRIRRLWCRPGAPGA